MWPTSRRTTPWPCFSATPASSLTNASIAAAPPSCAGGYRPLPRRRHRRDGLSAGQTRRDARNRYEDYLAERGAQALWEAARARRGRRACHPHNSSRRVAPCLRCSTGTSYAAPQLSGLHERKAHYGAQFRGFRWTVRCSTSAWSRRVGLMVEAGLVDECGGLSRHSMGADLTARRAIGYKEVLDYLDGSCTLDEAIRLISPAALGAT